jgi:Na+/H+-translocating membrane pyrophosphatase
LSVAKGTFFGVYAVFGLLTGGLVSGVQLAISMSNTGGAWDNAKKYIEQKLSDDPELRGKVTKAFVCQQHGPRSWCAFYFCLLFILSLSFLWRFLFI